MESPKPSKLSTLGTSRRPAARPPRGTFAPWHAARGTWYDCSMDPLRDLRAWQERLERLSAPHSESWTPQVDVYETADRYVVSAELPGMARDQIELAVEDSRLTIRGHRADHTSEYGAIVHYHQVERGHGLFARTFEFADRINAEEVSADLSNGVLTVTLLKVPAPPVRRIEVR